MRFSIYKESRQGARAHNQDQIGYVYTPESVMIVVCDGMGGHLHGEIASQYMIEFMARAFRQNAQPKLRTPPREFLREAIAAGSSSLIQYAKNQNMPDTPRTTCVACVIQDGKLWWANVGDSRAYLVRDSAVFARTLDHSYVQLLMDRGKITPEQAAVHPERHKIYNCIGQPTPPKIDISEGMTLMPGDVILAATDGLWGPIPLDLLALTLSRSDVSVAMPMLLDMAEAVTGRECDNLSGVCLAWLDGDNRDPIPHRDSIYIPSESRTVFDDDVAIAVEMIMGAVHHKGS